MIILRTSRKGEKDFIAEPRNTRGMSDVVPTVIVTTPRCTLRPFVLDDLDAHAEILSDPLVTRYLPRGPIAPDDARGVSTRVLTHFIEHWQRHGFGAWAVIDRSNGELLGQCGLNYLPDDPEVEVLYLLRRSAWGRGIATETASFSVTYGFREADLPRIVGITMPENVASQRVLEKCGLRYEKDGTFYGVYARYFALDRPGQPPAATPA